jgi:hypothetical protein
VRRVKHLAIDVGIKKGKTKIGLLGNRWSSEEPLLAERVKKNSRRKVGHATMQSVLSVV